MPASFYAYRTNDANQFELPSEDGPKTAPNSSWARESDRYRRVWMIGKARAVRLVSLERFMGTHIFNRRSTVKVASTIRASQNTKGIYSALVDLDFA